MRSINWRMAPIRDLVRKTLQIDYCTLKLIFIKFSVKDPTSWSAKEKEGENLESLMQMEIMENGPITAGMEVYEDFLYYEGGIYKVEENVWNFLILFALSARHGQQLRGTRRAHHWLGGQSEGREVLAGGQLVEHRLGREWLLPNSPGQKRSEV